MLSTRNTEAVAEAIDDAFRMFDDTEHHEPDTVYEHGHWWVQCSTCGAQWDAVDAEGPDTFDGFSFEQVSEGDGFCDENEAD